MSLILEALKRSEKERQDKAGAGGSVATPGRDDAAVSLSRQRWMAALITLPVLAFAIGGVVGFFHLMPTPRPTAATTQAASKTPAAEASPAAPASQPAVTTAAATPQPAAAKPEAAAHPTRPETPAPPAAAEKPAAKTAAVAPEPAKPEPAAPAASATPSAPASLPMSRPISAPVSPPISAPPAASAPHAPPTGRLAAVAVPNKPAAPSRPTARPAGADEVRALMRRGRAYEDKGLYTQAIETYSRAIARDAASADAYYGRGWARLAKGDYGDAARDFEKTIALRPDAADAYLGRGWALEQQGQVDQAIRQYDAAIRLQPDHVDGYFSRGVLEFTIGRMAAAARDFTAVHDRASGRLKDYALLWHYVSQARGGVIAPTAAFDDWSDNAPWPGMLMKLFRGEATVAQVLAAAKDRDPERQRENECVAFFFVGQLRLINGDFKGAADYFRRTLATGVSHFRQYAAARAELERLKQKTD